MSREKKLSLVSANVSKRSKRKLYDFGQPPPQLERISAANRDLYMEILQHPTKDFRKLTKLASNSEILEDDLSEAPMFSLKKIVCTALIIKQLQKPIRHVLTKWRIEKELAILTMKYRLEHKELNLKKNQVTLLCKLRMINTRYLHRMASVYFCDWKLATIVEKHIYTERDQLQRVSQAKIEASESRNKLDKLYTATYQIRASGIGTQSVMEPFFKKKANVLPNKVQQLVNSKISNMEMVNQIKSLCYDMMLEVLEEAQKDSLSSISIRDNASN